MPKQKRFKVVITEIVTETVKGGQEWAKTGEELVAEGSDKLKAIYGYTPVIEKTQTTEVKVFEQTVDELNMAALVSVINNIGEGKPQ